MTRCEPEDLVHSRDTGRESLRIKIKGLKSIFTNLFTLLILILDGVTDSKAPVFFVEASLTNTLCN